MLATPIFPTCTCFDIFVPIFSTGYVAVVDGMAIKAILPQPVDKSVDDDGSLHVCFPSYGGTGVEDNMHADASSADPATSADRQADF